MKRIFFIFLAAVFLISSAEAATIMVRGHQIRGQGRKPNELISYSFVIPVGGAVIKRVRNSSNAGFYISGEGDIVLYRNAGENAVGVRLGPGSYNVYPYLQPGHQRDTVELYLAPQATGEWITKGGRQNIHLFRPTLPES